MPVWYPTTDTLACLVPLRACGVVNAPRRLMAILLGRRSTDDQCAQDMFGDLHSLTLSERAVLRGLVGGRTPLDLACERGVAVSTVRSQIASLRDKFGVPSISHLMRMLSELPPVSRAQKRFECGGAGSEH